jgi:hypothetical protein
MEQSRGREARDQCKSRQYILEREAALEGGEYEEKELHLPPNTAVHIFKKCLMMAFAVDSCI